MKKLINRWRNRKRYTFLEMPPWLLVIFGGSSFLICGYSGLALGEIVPAWVAAVNKIGYFDTVGTAIGFFLLWWGVVFWYFSCITARCHGILYDRWFK